MPRADQARCSSPVARSVTDRATCSAPLRTSRVPRSRAPFEDAPDTANNGKHAAFKSSHRIGQHVLRRRANLFPRGDDGCPLLGVWPRWIPTSSQYEVPDGGETKTKWAVSKPPSLRVRRTNASTPSALLPRPMAAPVCSSTTAPTSRTRLIVLELTRFHFRPVS